ncbi:MAG: TraY domain-containing protein [Clostridia bacterium]|nr:TraY domain-containing protein [Clostridia bacterium]
MPRKKKDAKFLNIRLDRQIHEELEAFCTETGRTKTKAVEMVLSEFLKQDKKKKNRSAFR